MIHSLTCFSGISLELGTGLVTKTPPERNFHFKLKNSAISEAVLYDFNPKIPEFRDQMQVIHEFYTR